MRERGSILLHVMVTGAVLALVAASLLRMTMLRYQMGGRSGNILREKRDDQGGLASILATWNAANKVCGGAPTGWSGCVNPGNCSCTCVQGGATPVVVTASLNSAGLCRVIIQSADLP